MSSLMLVNLGEKKKIVSISAMASLIFSILLTYAWSELSPWLVAGLLILSIRTFSWRIIIVADVLGSVFDSTWHWYCKCMRCQQVILFNELIKKHVDCKFIFVIFCWSWSSNTLATWCKEPTHLKRSWCCERWKVRGEGDDRGWDGWMASLTQWTWICVNSGSWWWTGRPGVLQSMGSQRVGHDWATELNWTDINIIDWLWDPMYSIWWI